MKHKTFVSKLYQQPSMIEQRFRPLFKEFALGRGRIDIIGRDRKGILCLVEVKMRKSEVLQGLRQVEKYQRQLMKFLSLASLEVSLRAMVVTPDKKFDVGIKKSIPHMFLETPLEIPTTREVFGFQKTEEKS